MTKKELEQYLTLKKESELLEKRINSIQDTNLVEHAFVKGSNDEFPYQKKSFHVSGFNSIYNENKELERAKLIKTLEEQKNKCDEAQINIQKYINSLNNSCDRVICNMLYIEGMTQEKIGECLNMDRSTISKKISKIFQKLT